MDSDTATLGSSSSYESENSIVSANEFSARIKIPFNFGIFAKMVNEGIDPCHGGKFVTLQLLRFVSHRYSGVLLTLSDGANTADVHLSTVDLNSLASPFSVVCLINLRYNFTSHTWSASEMTTSISASNSKVAILTGPLPQIAPRAQTKKRSVEKSSQGDTMLPETMSPKRQNVADVLVRMPGDSQKSAPASPTVPVPGDIRAESLLGSAVYHFARLRHIPSLKNVSEGLTNFFVGPVRVEVQPPRTEKQPWCIDATDAQGDTMRYKVFSGKDDDVQGRFAGSDLFFIGNGEPKYSTYSRAVEVLFSMSLQSGNQRFLIVKQVPLSKSKPLMHLFQSGAAVSSSSSSSGPAAPLSVADYLLLENAVDKTGVERGLSVRGVLREVGAPINTKAGKPYRMIRIAQTESTVLTINVWSSAERVMATLSEKLGESHYTATHDTARVVQLSGLSIDHSRSKYQSNIADTSTLEFLTGVDSDHQQAINSLPTPAPLLTLTQAMAQPENTYFDLLVLVPACSEARPTQGANGPFMRYDVNAFDNSGLEHSMCVRFKLFKGNMLVHAVRDSGPEMEPAFKSETGSEGIVVCQDPARVTVALLHRYKLFVPHDTEGTSLVSGSFGSQGEPRRYLVRDRDSSEEVLTHGDPRAQTLLKWYNEGNGYTLFVPDLAPTVKRTPEEYAKLMADTKLITGPGNGGVPLCSSLASGIAVCVVSKEREDEAAIHRASFGGILKNLKRQ